MASPTLQIFIWAFIFHIIFTSIIAQDLIFNGFKQSSNNITLNGAAKIIPNGVLQLTNVTNGILGHAFYESPIKLKSSSTGKALSFSAIFAFVIKPQYEALGGHGFAFTMAPNPYLKGALPRQYLGLSSVSDNGNLTDHFVAVEFDEVQDFAFKDINDNHVGVDINSLISNFSVPAAYYVDGKSTALNLTLKSGKMILAWIDYDSDENVLNVTLSPSSLKPNRSCLSYRVDLSVYLDEFMYVGFSASTGLLSSAHYILGWSFNVGGEAKSLDLASLPSIPVSNKTSLAFILGISFGSILGLIFAIGLGIYIAWRIKNRDVIESWELDIGPHRFPYEELKKATRGFKDKELLGFGGFGRVYKGTLPNSDTQVAVKRISHESKQGLQEFVNEIASIGRLRHRNLVQLLGWCRRREDLILVYEYMPNGSLDKYLFDVQRVLSWKERFKIIKDVASGLLYLHEEWEQAVIHRDIKAGNVLLDSELNGRLSDFGLAKLYEHGSNPSTTRVVGTLGYLAPELTRTGKATTSSDVFAFGALLLEVACGRRPIESNVSPEKLILVDLVWERWTHGEVLDVIDPKLKGEYDEKEALVVLKLGLLCSSETPLDRPTIRQVMRYLNQEAMLSEVIAPPSGSKGQRGGNGCRGESSGGEFEDYTHSYPSSSCMEKVSKWSSNADEYVVEAGSSSSPFSLSRGAEAR